MMNSDELVQKKESSNDESINLTRLSGKEISELAKGKAGKRDGGDRTKGSILLMMIQILLVIFQVMYYICPMLLDPLFLYVPIINENMKCLALDEKLKKTAIDLRSFMDLLYLPNIIYHVRSVFGTLRSPNTNIYWWRKASRILKFLIQYILPVLPIPQIVILIFLPRTRDSRSWNRMQFLNSLILLQYVARASPVYTLCKKYNKGKNGPNEYSTRTPLGKKLRIPGVLNFMSYILASHVLGAFWYFFSVQREIDCWISTCRSENGCDLSTLQCNNTTFRNVTLLNDLCPTNPPNPMTFNFGIFVDPLQSGIVGTTDFPQKLFMCFSWGIRNLSSFASNLNTTSAYAWESVFVVSISTSGLLLFIYLLGHLETFMQATRRTSRTWQRRKVILPKIKFMLSEYGLDNLATGTIWELVTEKLEEDEDHPVENIFSLLPLHFQKHLKRHLFLDTLQQLQGLEIKDRRVLEAIMECLEPVNYADGSYFIREGEPLDRMLFITQGSVLAYKTSNIGGGSGSSSIERLAKGKYYGKELIVWAAPSASFSGLPISTKTVKSHTKVEVFALKADDLQLVVSKFPDAFNKKLKAPLTSG